MGMKNRKFLGKRGLSVLLSLALCMGMVSPAFAASFSQLQGAITNGESVYQEGKDASSKEEGAEKYKIEASKDENGVSVKLWEDVGFNKETDNGLWKNGSGIEISGENTNVTLDLNGKTIDLNPEYTFDGSNFKDETGKSAAPKDLNTGRIFSVQQGASLTVNDSSAIKKDAEGKDYYDRETGSGQIKGGNSSSWGGGVSVNNGSFTMNGGSITGNIGSRGGGIAAANNATIELNGVNISGNKASTYGGGIYLEGARTVTIKGSAISENNAPSGGGIRASGTETNPVTIKISDNSQIEGNSAGQNGGGIIAFNNVTLNMTNTEVNNNQCGTGTIGGGAIAAIGKDNARPSISLSDVSFDGNYAGSKPGYSGTNVGGALYLDKADVSVSGSVAFGSNTAKTPSGNNKVVENDIYIKGENGTAGVTIEKGGKLIDKETNSETTYPDGTTLVKSGNDVASTGISVTKTVDEEKGTVTIVTNDGTQDTSNRVIAADSSSVTVDKNGTATIATNYKETEGNSEVTYLPGAEIDKNGNLTGATVTKTDNGDNTVTIKTNDGTEDTSNRTFTVDDPSKVTVDDKGTSHIPGGSKLTGTDDSETTYPDGAEIDRNGNIKGESVTKGEDDNGNTVITSKDENDNQTAETTVDVPDGKKGEVEVDGETGNTEIPGGSKITDDNGETTYPGGATIHHPDGSIDDHGSSVTKKDNEDDGSTTITNKTKDENGEDKTVENKVDVPEGKKDDVKVDDEGNTDVPDGGKITDKDNTETTYPDGATIKPDGTIDDHGSSTARKDNDDGSSTITNKTTNEETGEQTETKHEVEVPADKKDNFKVNDDGSTTVPPGGKIDDKTYPDGATIRPDGTIDGKPEQSDDDNNDNNNNDDNNDPSENPEQPEQPEQPDVPGDDDDFGDDGAGTATIAEQDVPLAGIVLVKDVLAELYKHEGSPDGEDAEGEYVKAIAWAIANGIVAEDADVDAVVTVAVLKEMLTNYAASVGGVLTVRIDGENDDVVMNCGEILAKVFETL